MLAILCPGQGAQTPGFLGAWADGPLLAEVDRLGAAAGLDLARLGTDPDADVVDTAVAQPLVVAAGIASANLLGTLPASTVMLGHSVGELAAASLAGCWSASDAVAAARSRGLAMAAASAASSSGMVAVLGGDAQEVADAATLAGCWVANVNATGQVVVAGPTDAIDRLMADPPSRARLRRLSVAGAFHTPLMATAEEAWGKQVAEGAMADPSYPLLSDADGELVTTGADLRRRLIAQVTLPVRFDLCLVTLRRLGVTATIELAPAGVLTAIVRRELPDVTAVALRGPDDIEVAHALLEEHPHGERLDDGWRVVTAPQRGTFHRDVDDSGAGLVRNRAGDLVVTLPAGATRVEWLVTDGDPVGEGQPLLRMEVG